MNPLLTRRNTLALAGAGAFAPAAFAQGTFPDRAVNMIVPFAPARFSTVTA